MKRRLLTIFVVVIACMCMMSTISVCAEVHPELDITSKSVVPGGEFDIAITIYSSDIVQGSTLDVEYDSTVIEYVSHAKFNLDTLQDDGAGNIQIIQAEPSPSYPKSPTLCSIRFKVKQGAMVGTESTIKVKLKDVTDETFAETAVNMTVECKITVIASATPVPATPTPVPPTNTPVVTPVKTPTATSTSAPSATPFTPTGEPGSEEPTGEIVPTDDAEPTFAPTVLPTIEVTSAPNDKNNTVSSDLFGFGLLIAAIVGVWVGLACGFFIWGRGKQKQKPKHYTIGGDN